MYSSTFRSWGFQPSEDVEFSSAYLSLSEVPVDGVTPKLAILARGLAMYLQYPLVAAAIVASIPVLEANESLNLVEEAYDILARRAMPAAQGELICLAVRIHRRSAQRDRDRSRRYRDGGSFDRRDGILGRPQVPLVPIIVAHGGYYSTFSGVGGVSSRARARRGRVLRVNRAIVSILAFVSLLLFAVPGGTSTPFTDHYVPKAGDGFSYVETTNLDGGIGNYTGYTETSTTTGSETVVSVAPNGTANATWNYTTHWRNNTGSSQQWSSGGRFSFSTATFDYIHGTDNQSGENGSHVWFWMNTSLPVGSSFYPLQTQLTVVSDNTSYHLGNNPGKWVATIYAEGSGSFPRNDVYGKFTATYTTQYDFDPVLDTSSGSPTLSRTGIPRGTGSRTQTRSTRPPRAIR